MVEKLTENKGQDAVEFFTNLNIVNGACFEEVARQVGN